jgi:hypothetical protein
MPKSKAWAYLGGGTGRLLALERKLLTCDFVTPRLSPPTACARERDITDLITAYREGATAASLATADGLSLTSVKCRHCCIKAEGVLAYTKVGRQAPQTPCKP